MEEILNKHCKESKTGLLLLSMPTGSGKTYNVLNFIYSNYKKFADGNRKIFFITNLKKNLPIEDLRKRFIEHGNEEDFEKYILFIDSNVDTVINNLLKVDSEIPEQFKKEIYPQLKSYVEKLQNKHIDESFRSIIKTEIQKNIEPKFRKIIKNKLYEQFKTKKERLAAIKSNKNYQWIGKLYPAVFTSEKTVFFLSIDKFVVKNTTLVEPSYYFYESLINNPLIFIDEFDSTKAAVLKNIIESGLRHRVDILNLFLNIHNYLMQNEFPEWLFQESKLRQQKSSGKNWLSLAQQIESFKQETERIFTTYKLQYNCKSHEEFLTKKRSFLFYDYEFHNVLDRKKRIEIIEDSQRRTNWIKAFDITEKAAGVDIQKLLREINGFLTYFQRGIKFLAENYCHLKQEKSSIQESFPLELAVQTVLNQFHLDSKDVEFLTINIMEGELPNRWRGETGITKNQGFYDTGFCYYDIVDSDEHDTLSKIYLFNFNRTPESFLATVCSKAMVVGISATAGLYTNIGNYDIEYLKYRLEDSFIRIEKNDIARLKGTYSEATKGYKQVAIKTEFIGDIGEKSQEEAIKQLEILLDDREAANHLWHTLQSKIQDNPSSSYIKFLFCRYVRALTAWKYFLDNYDDCHSFLCFFNKLPNDYDPELNLKTLHEYAKLLLDKDINVSDTIVVLTSDKFDETKQQLLDDLKDNKHRFIISSYQTIGVGQNLQFPVPYELNTIHINDFPKHYDMDINGIYLENPTNLLVNIHNKDIEDNDFIKYIFQLEFLRENGSISRKTFKNKLDQAFRQYIGEHNPVRNTDDFIKLHETDAYSRHLNKVIIQAIGRICRTNMKAPKIHILADAALKKHLNKYFIPEDIIPVHEYTALLESAGALTNQSENLKEAQNQASHRSNHTASIIRRQLNTPWTSQSVEKWKELRQQVLSQPAIAKESECVAKWKHIYLRLPKAANSYYFVQENDYHDIEIFFSDGDGKKQIPKVSEETARLPDLMRIDIFRELFINSGWATAFPDSELMLTPPIFNNIYKGALGEVCGKHIFETILESTLLELDVDEFEQFDFKTDRNIYIDFKFWTDRVTVGADELITKIRDKMTIVGAEKALVVNILGSSDTTFRPIISSDKKIVEIPYLCKNDKLDESTLKFILEQLST
jgi:hypothetical protein